MATVTIQWNNTEDGISYSLSIDTDKDDPIEVVSGAFLSAAVVNLALSSGTAAGFLVSQQRDMVYQMALEMMKESGIDLPE